MSGQRGFTLLEVLVASSIAAIGIVTVLELFAGSSRLAGAATRQSEATITARAVMDQALWQADLDNGLIQDRWGEYAWTLEVRPIEPQFGSTEENPRENESVEYELKEVVVTVRWNVSGGAEKSITLNSARIMEQF